MRDCFSRELSRVKKLKSGSESSRKNPYVYYNQLLFLTPVVQNKHTETNLLPDTDKNKETVVEGPFTNETNDELQSNSTSGQTKKKRKQISMHPVEKEIIEALHKSIQLRQEQNQQMEDDDDRMFLLSLLKPLKQIPEPLRFSVRMDLMNVINQAQVNSQSASLIFQPQHQPLQNQIMPQTNLESNLQRLPWTMYQPHQQIQHTYNQAPNRNYPKHFQNQTNSHIISKISTQQPNDQATNTNYVKVLQNQTDVQIRPTTSIHQYPYISTPIQTPSISINSNSTENSSDSIIQDIFN